MNIDSPIFVPRNGQVPMNSASDGIVKAVGVITEPAKSSKAAPATATFAIDGRGLDNNNNNNNGSNNTNCNSLVGYWPLFGNNATQLYANNINNKYLRYCQQFQQQQQQPKQHQQQQHQQYLHHFFQRQRTFHGFHNQWATTQRHRAGNTTIGQQQQQQLQQPKQQLHQRSLQQLQHKSTITKAATTTALVTCTNRQRNKTYKMAQKQQQQLQQELSLLDQQLPEKQMQQQVDITNMLTLKETYETKENLSASQLTAPISLTTTTAAAAIAIEEIVNKVGAKGNNSEYKYSIKNDNDNNNNGNDNNPRDDGDIKMATLPPLSIVALTKQSTQLADEQPEMQTTRKNDTVQRNSSRAVHHHIRHTKYYQQQQQQQQQSSNSKTTTDASDSGISTNSRHHHHHHQRQPHQHHHHHHQQQQNNIQNNHKQRKTTRSSSKRQENSNNNNINQTMTSSINNNSNNNNDNTKCSTNNYSINEWLSRRGVMVYCYDHRCISSCNEENNMSATRHNPAHRNSTSSEAAASDDQQCSSSSNEDLSNVYTVIAQPNQKAGGGGKSRRHRQQRQRNRNRAHCNRISGDEPQLQAIPMDVDEEGKENVCPVEPSGHEKHMQQELELAQEQQQYNEEQQQLKHFKQIQQKTAATGSRSSSSNNLRKQCTKAAALKILNKDSSDSSSSCSSSSNNNNRNRSKSSSKTAKLGNATDAHALTHSPSNSSVCSSLSSASSSSNTSTCKSSASFSSSSEAATTSASASSSSSSSHTPTSSSSSCSSSTTSSANSSPSASPTVIKRKLEKFRKIASAITPPLRQQMKLNMSEAEFVQQLRRYIIDPNLLRIYGYPVESAIHEGCIEIYKCLPRPTAPYTHHWPGKMEVVNTTDGLQLSNDDTTAATCSSAALLSESDTTESSTVTVDANLVAAVAATSGAKWPFAPVPENATDSGQASADCSPPSMDSDASETGEDEPATTTACYTPDGSFQIFSQYDQSLEKQCVRCQRTFHVTEAGEYLSQESCTFHWGKLYNLFTSTEGFTAQYTCCERNKDAQGCTYNSLHVWTGAVVGMNGPYSDFVQTRPRYYGSGEDEPAAEPKVYALDCEMSFTGRGLEVTKVTVVGFDGQLVYEHYVKPEAEIVDYNTRFSGVTAKDLCKQTNKDVKTLAQVQRDLLTLIDADSILIGHGLDNDLRVLRIVHKTIVDTSIVFPHSSGFPYRRALKSLTKFYLNRDIQCGKVGHNSFEDSRACLELMMWKVCKDMRPMAY